MKRFKTLLQEIAENQKPKTLVIGWGRFNPPHIGHAVNFNKIIKKAKEEGGDYQFYTSQTNDNDKNPLSYKDKVDFLKKMFPEHADKFVYDTKIRTIFNVVNSIFNEDKGYTKLILGLGPDQIKAFEQPLLKYNFPESTGYYYPDGIEFLNTGKDDEEDKGKGKRIWSATQSRAAAAANDYTEFDKGTPKGFKYTRELFDAVRNGLAIDEEKLLEAAYNIPLRTEDDIEKWTSDKKVQTEIKMLLGFITSTFKDLDPGGYYIVGSTNNEKIKIRFDDNNKPKQDAIKDFIKANNLTFISDKSRMKIAWTWGHGSGSKKEGGKISPQVATRCKEIMSLIIFKNWTDNSKIIEIEKAIALMSKYKADVDLCEPKLEIYYQSALNQLKAFKKINIPKGAVYELQRENYSRPIYTKAKELGATDADSWNPADLWIFAIDKSTIKQEIKDFETLSELNDWLSKKYNSHEVFAISLKQVEGVNSKANLEIMQPATRDTGLSANDLDFTLKTIYLPPSLKSERYVTNSGFILWANAKRSASNPELYFEGKMEKSKVFLGNIDKGTFTDFIRERSTYPPALSIEPTKTLMDQSRAIYIKYADKIRIDPKEKTDQSIFKVLGIGKGVLPEMTHLKKQRYIHLAYFLNFMMNNYDEAMKKAYTLAKSITPSSPMHLKIS